MQAPRLLAPPGLQLLTRRADEENHGHLLLPRARACRGGTVAGMSEHLRAEGEGEEA